MRALFALLIFGLSFGSAFPQPGPAGETEPSGLWHGIPRAIRYKPDGDGFVIQNGNRRFNRALYGGNTAFRVEAGDLPQFALYLPGMGGSMAMGILAGDSSKWLIHANAITATYYPGTMQYTVEDPLLGKGRLLLSVVARTDAEGLLVKMEAEHIPPGVQLFWSFGGATGKRFNRDGDIGADPESSFYLLPEYCADNVFSLKGHGFTLHYGSGRTLSEAERYEIQHRPANETSGTAFGPQKQLFGVVPPSMPLRVGDANLQSSPVAFWESKAAGAPALTGLLPLSSGQPFFFSVQTSKNQPPEYDSLPALFDQAFLAQRALAGRVVLQTPDAFINPFGGALAVAADAIWEAPSFLHGAVAWRMRLNGWRGPYAADPLGWHDRARTHFDAYAQSQLTTPETGPITPDTALNFARQKETLGTALFSSGYICRNPGGQFQAHHYDMNLVFIDQLIRHLQWTGDLAYAREIWPVLQRHLAWEKRNFDGDGDGLYDAYCAIWASDALEYSGGGVTHSSAYNYKANRFAAFLAGLIGEDPAPFQEEAGRIHQAMNQHLWMPDKGWYAEFQDALGKKPLHPSAGLWTIYHALDSEVADPFQAYQCLRYVDCHIPHIPIQAEGAPSGLHTLSTTNWMPYTWSVNNVAYSEVLHTSLAYWQSGRKEEAFQLWKSALVESMYLGASPGSFQQLSFYDAFRGELYRDFADPIGIAARTLVEGLFGIRPDALKGILTIQPGLPDAWNEAVLEVPDIAFHFERNGNTDRYRIKPAFAKPMFFVFRTKARKENIVTVKINNVKVDWKPVNDAVGFPLIELRASPAAEYELAIEWSGAEMDSVGAGVVYPAGGTVRFQTHSASLKQVYDPQGALSTIQKNDKGFQAKALSSSGFPTVFIQLRQGAFTWWAPLNLEIRDPVALLPAKHQPADGVVFQLQNNLHTPVQIEIQHPYSGKTLHPGVSLAPGAISAPIALRSADWTPGTISLKFLWQNGEEAIRNLTHWNLRPISTGTWETVDLSPFFNDRVSQLFEHRYEFPRATYPTVQIPLQGVGNWCYPLVKPALSDQGLRALAGHEGKIATPLGVPFATPGPGNTPNVLFTSRWDNFPDEAEIPLSGKARQIYLLMAGTTNAMQSRLTNGNVTVGYADGSMEVLPLVNPDTWHPIEQDYLRDGFAFDWESPAPLRVHLKTGWMGFPGGPYTSIKGYSDRVIDGGAATVLDLPLNPNKELKYLRVSAIANEVVVGLLSATLLR